MSRRTPASTEPSIFAGGIPWYNLHCLLTLEEKLKIFRLAGYQPHAGQLPIHASTARMRVVVCGRRFGKSTAAAYEAIAFAAVGGRVWVVAPDYDLASIVYEEAVHVSRTTQIKHLVVERPKLAKGSQAIHFRGGGWIVGKSSVKPQSLVGRGLDLIVFDECAKEPNPEVWHAHLRPALTDRRGALLGITTPMGDDWVKELYQRGVEGEPGYASFRMSSYQNPLLDPAEIDGARTEIPDATFRQEYLAEFLDAEGAVFAGYRDVATSVLRDEPDPLRRYVIGVDLAKYEDWTVLTVMDVHSGEVCHVYRGNQAQWGTQREIIHQTALRWNCADVMIDSTGVGDPVAEELTLMAGGRYNVSGYVFTMTSKTQIINQAVVAIQQKEVALPRDDTDLGRVYLSEMGSYRYHRSDAGNLKMSAPSGKHDDCVISFCLAQEGRMRYSGGPPPRTRLVEPDPGPSLAGQYTVPEPSPPVKRTERRSPMSGRFGRNR